MDLYNNPAIRERAELLVRQNVHYCVSALVSALQSSDACSAMGVDYEDEVLPILQRDDWEEPALEWIDRASADELADTCDYLDVDPGSDAREALRQYCDGDDEQSRELCDYNRIDPHTVEAFEHWIVDGWFAGKLEERGEMIARDLLGLTIWGRATTGQSISMDSVILDIAREALEA